MKRIFILLAVVIAPILTIGQSKVATIHIKASIYCDHCKQCESCGKRLENAIFTEKGVKRVEINEKDKTVKVIYNSDKTTPEKLRTAISKVGFDADNVKADAAAYAKLDPCCQK